MSEELELTVIEQREVVFYDDQLTAVRAGDGHIYVSVRHLCDSLGVTRQGQVNRIKRSDVLLEGYRQGTVETGPGGRQPAGLLRVDLVPLFLTGISIRSIRPEIRPKLKQYQKEAARVLWEAFQSGRLTTPDDIMTADSPAARAYQLAMAIADLARQQYVLEARLGSAELRLEDLGGRVESLESRLGAGTRHVSDEQASQLSQAVKAVAMALAARSGRNEYGGVYGELYRRFSITSYKLLPAAQFSEAISFLTQWHEQLTGDDTPF